MTLSSIQALSRFSLHRCGFAAPRWKWAGLLVGVVALSPLLASTGGGGAIKAVLAVAGLGLLVVVGLRARGARSSANPETVLRVVSRSALSPRAGIAVVEFGRQRLLVGFGDGFVQVLTRSRERSPRKEGSP